MFALGKNSRTFLVLKRVTLLLMGLVLVPFLASTASAQEQGHVVNQDTQEPPGTPGLRLTNFYKPRAYPFDSIPAGAYNLANKEYEQLFGANSFGAPDAVGPAGLTGTWTQVGPTRIGTTNAVSGRMSAVAVHPTTPTTVYIGAAQGGVWRTTNNGLTWSPLTDTQCSLAMGDIAIDPVNPNIIYAGTGEQHNSADSYYGCGVLRSTNGGTSWTQLGAANFDFTGGGSRIARLRIKPNTAGSTTTTTIFAASDNGVWRSTNSGGTWTRVLVGKASDLSISRQNNNLMYAAISNNGVFRSTNGGTTWNKLAGGLPIANIGRINLDMAPSNGSVGYVSIQSTANNALLGIWRTANSGNTWTQMAATNASCGSQCWYDMYVRVAPNNFNHVYFGGVSLYKSTNGGASFSNITGGIHVDQHYMGFHPTNPSVVYAVNDGGVYRSSNAGGSWSSLNTNLAVTQFYSGLSVAPTNPNLLLGGTQDNHTNLYTGSTTWNSVNFSGVGGCDGSFTMIDPSNTNRRYGQCQWQRNAFYSGPRRTDAGTGGTYARKMTGINANDRAQFIPPLRMSPSNPARIYFGTYRLYRSTNRGENWTAVTGDITGGVGSISNMAEAPSNSNYVYVTTNNGRVYVTTNGAAYVNRSAGLPNRAASYVAVHPTKPATAYVTFQGFNTGHVYKTINAGVTWTNVSGNLINVPVNAILIDPNDPETDLIVGTDLGVYQSTNGGTTWGQFNAGLPRVAVFDLTYQMSENTVYAATHGRSVYKRPLLPPPGAANNNNIADARVISGTAGTTTVANNAAYTTQGGERKHFTSASANNVRSAWYKWTAPSTGQMRFDAAGSGASNPVMAVYYAESSGSPIVSRLTQITSDDNTAGSFDPRVWFHAISGRTYFIAVAAASAGNATGSYRLNWTRPAGTSTGLVASILPYARAVRNTTPATAFATIINASGSAATNCNIQLPPQNYARSLFQYRTVNASNIPTGTLNRPVNIPANGSQGFVFGITPYLNLNGNTDAILVFDCENRAPVVSTIGLNTFKLSSGAAAPADMVAVGATSGTPAGTVVIPGATGTSAFAAAVVNNGGPNTLITASADDGAAVLPVSLTVCRTTAGGVCLAAPSASVSWNAATDVPYTFTVFVKGNGVVPFDPANNRIFLRFREGTTTRGATTVAVRTQ